MIFAKINPAATISKQISPFHNEFITGSYMTALARPYALGSDSVKFEVQYGEVAFDNSGSVTSFKNITSTQLTLSGSAISNWGTNDSEILNSIASNIGTTIVSIVSGSINNRIP